MSDLDPTLAYESPTTRSRLPLLLGVLVAVLALGAGAVFVVVPLLSDDDTDPQPVVADTEDTDQTDETVEPAAQDAPSSLPVVTYEVFLARDPFQPVVPEEVPDPDPTDPDPTDPDPTDPDPTDPDDPDPADPDPTDPDPDDPDARRCVGQEEVVCNGHVVSLVDVTTDDDGRLTAVVQVDTTLHEVVRGDTFAERFTLFDVTSSSATIRFVDETFSLMVGDRVLK